LENSDPGKLGELTAVKLLESGAERLLAAAEEAGGGAA
jgi:hypothetical protein